jgi:hypothetical protein
MASVGVRVQCGVHSSGSVVRSPAVRPVRCPVRPVSSRLGSSFGIRRPAVWCPPVRCPAVWCPLPSVRTSPSGPHQAVAFGTGRCGKAPAPRKRAQVLMGCRIVSGSGSTAEPARTRAPPPRSPMVGGGPGLGRCGRRRRLTLASRGRPGRRAEGLSPAAALWARKKAAARGCRTGREAAVLGMGDDHCAWLSWRLPPGWTSSEGPMGLPAEMGLRPQRGPGSQRAFPARCWQRSELRRWVVGLPGLEPGTSSLSAIEGSPLCNPAFSQVAADRRGRSNAL